MKVYALATAAMSVAVWCTAFAAATYFGHLHILAAVIAATLTVAVANIGLAVRNLGRL